MTFSSRTSRAVSAIALTFGQAGPLAVLACLNSPRETLPEQLTKM
jgi:hypothetical protein